MFSATKALTTFGKGPTVLLKEIDDIWLDTESNQACFDINCTSEKVFIHEYGNSVDGIIHNSKLHVYDLINKNLTEVPVYPPTSAIYFYDSNGTTYGYPKSLRCHPTNPNEFFVALVGGSLHWISYDPSTNSVTQKGYYYTTEGVSAAKENFDCIDFYVDDNSLNMYYSCVQNAGNARVFAFDILNQTSLPAPNIGNMSGGYANGRSLCIVVNSLNKKIYAASEWDHQVGIFNINPANNHIDYYAYPKNIMNYGAAGGGAYWSGGTISPDNNTFNLFSSAWSRWYNFDVDIFNALPNGDNASTAKTSYGTGLSPSPTDMQYSPNGEICYAVQNTSTTYSGIITALDKSFISNNISYASLTSLKNYGQYNLPRTTASGKYPTRIAISKNNKYAVCQYYTSTVQPKFKIFTEGLTDPNYDPFAQQTTLILRANSDSTVTDVSSSNNIITGNFLVNVAYAQFKGTYGIGWGYNSQNYGTSPASSDWTFGTGDFTVEGWFYFSASYPTQVKTFVSAYPSWELQHRSNAWVWGHGDPQIISRSYTTGNKWVHVAVCRSNGVMRMFFDGVQQGAAVNNSDDIGSHDLYLGNLSSAIQFQPAAGYMQDVRITKAARYTQNFTPPWSFE